MANFIELAIEKMIQDGIVTEAELKQRIEEEREKSPINDLNNIAFVEGMQMGMIDNLGAMIGALMMQINALEQRVAELEGTTNA